MLKPLLLAATAAGLLAACATPQSQPDLASRAASAPRANCLTTGTRIALKEGQCVSAPGRVFTKEDLDNTGATTPLEALRRLDPSLSR